jgi:sec-independent protein translocase protein TatA
VGDLLTPVHLIIVLGIALLVFGPKRLPELGAGLGKSLREFREATSGMTNPLDKENFMPVETPQPYMRPGTPTTVDSMLSRSVQTIDPDQMDTGG